MPTFYEFFAGGGMANAGLGKGWTCIFANDIDTKKADSYRENWGDDHLKVGDVAEVTLDDLPQVRADLAWASFPCQDLSLAGAGAGLSGARSGTFHPFWELMRSLNREGRGPKLVVLENVVGALTAGKNDTSGRSGQDFVELGKALASESYRFGAVVVDAVHWVPQSRPRLFIIAVHESLPISLELVTASPSPDWHPSALKSAYQRIVARAGDAAERWLWWKLPEPPEHRVRFQTLDELIEAEHNPEGVDWHTPEQTQKLLSLMNEGNLAKVTAAQDATRVGGRRVGTVYKRMRPEGPEIESNGVTKRQNVQRAEVRFDDIAGCLRTPSGGSSRQTIIVVEDGRVRSRLLSPLEVIRLMGLEDNYKRPASYNDAYHLAGDGVAVDVVRFLAENILEPLLSAEEAEALAVDASEVSEAAVKIPA